MEKKYCINCGKEAAELHHIVPLALGGNDIDSNKVWLCIECHNKIHNRSLDVRKLAAESLNFKKAIAEGRVGRPEGREEKYDPSFQRPAHPAHGKDAEEIPG